MKALALLASLLLSSCALAEMRVSFEEMSADPVLKVRDDSLVVETRNSARHSSYLIARITVEEAERTMVLRGYQTIYAPYREEFAFSIEDLKLERKINDYRWVWEDADGKYTEVEWKDALDFQSSKFQFGKGEKIARHIVTNDQAETVENHCPPVWNKWYAF